MDEKITISVSKDEKSKMIKMAREEIDKALSMQKPTFNGRKDMIRLRKYVRGPNRIKLTYEILRDSRRSSSNQSRAI